MTQRKSFSDKILACLPQFIVDYASRYVFHIQFLLEDFASFQPIQYLIIAISYSIFLLFGIGFRGLTGFTIITGRKSIREDSGNLVIEGIFLGLSIIGLLNFFSQGFRKYELSAQDRPRKSLNTLPRAKSANFILNFFSAIWRMIQQIKFNIIAMKGSLSRKHDRQLYIWYYHPFLRNVFIFFNPLQILLFMVQKRVQFPLKLVLLLINAMFTFLLYILIFFFEQKAHGEKDLAAQVMQVQQDFFVRWNHARRLAEREVVKELLDSGDLDAERHRLSSISRRMQATQEHSLRKRSHNESDDDDRSEQSDEDNFRSTFDVVPPKDSRVSRESRSSRSRDRKSKNPFQRRM